METTTLLLTIYLIGMGVYAISVKKTYENKNTIIK